MNSSFSPILMALLFAAFVAPLVPPTIPTSMHAQYHDQSSTANNGFQTTLLHVDHDKRLTKTEILHRALKRGEKRVQWLQSNIKAGPAIETATLDASGEYLIQLSIGTPTPSPITLNIDTSSNLIWTQCLPCNPCSNQSTPIFDPRQSHSYSKLRCSTKLCKALFRPICKKGYCNYNSTYADNSHTQGALATETFTFEGNVKVPGIGFGCGFSVEWDSFTASGIMGLGRGALSLVSQMNQSRFSYCLPTFGSLETGTFAMGCQATNPPGVQVNSMPLIINPRRPFQDYYLSPVGITIGHTRLRVNESTFEIREDGPGGMIIDCGTTLTFLEESAFDQVKNELTRQLGLNTTDGRLDLCFNMTSRHSKRVKFPVIVFHFRNGVNLELKRESYLHTYDHGVGCLMMENSGKYFDLSILGNYQLQNTLVVFDLEREGLSFLPMQL